MMTSPTRPAIEANGRREGDGRVVARRARRQQDREQHQHGDGAGVDQHLDDGDEVGGERDVDAGNADEREDEEQDGVNRSRTSATMRALPRVTTASTQKATTTAVSFMPVTGGLQQAGRSRTQGRPGACPPATCVPVPAPSPHRGSARAVTSLRGRRRQRRHLDVAHEDDAPRQAVEAGRDDAEEHRSPWRSARAMLISAYGRQDPVPIFHSCQMKTSTATTTTLIRASGMQHLPGEGHQLVDAQARQRASQPDQAEVEEVDLADEDDPRRDVLVEAEERTSRRRTGWP